MQGFNSSLFCVIILSAHLIFFSENESSGVSLLSITETDDLLLEINGTIVDIMYLEIVISSNRGYMVAVDPAVAVVYLLLNSSASFVLAVTIKHTSSGTSL